MGEQVGKRISIDRKKDKVWLGEEYISPDGGIKTPNNYGRVVEAFDGSPREGNGAGDRDLTECMKIDEDRYRRLDISNMHTRGPLEDYTRP